MSGAEVSVLVCTYNRRQLLLETLDSLDRQTAIGQFEVVVAIDGSSDGTLEALEVRQSGAPLRWVWQPNAGAAAARNAAAGLARNDVLLFLDDDQLAAPNLVAAHRDAHQRQPGALVQGVYPLAPESTGRGASLAYELTRSNAMAGWDGTGTPWHLWGGNFSLTRATWAVVGGFDESFRIYGGEDEDFGLRAQALGVPVVLELDAVSHHVYQVSYRSFRRNAFNAGRSAVRVSRKHNLALDELPGSAIRPVDRVIGRAWRISPSAVGALGVLASGGSWLADRTGLPGVPLAMARLVRRLHYVGGVTVEGGLDRAPEKANPLVGERRAEGR